MSSIAEWDFGRTDALPDGPWKSEPDKVYWIDEATGLDCLILRNRLNTLCGYVGVPPEHPWHGADYASCLRDECPDEWHYECTPGGRLRVHGGLTFSGFCAEGHGDDAICHVPQPGRPANVKWFGFDCAHAGDLTPYRDGSGILERFPGDEYRDLAYVKAEVRDLAQQLVAVTS